MSTVSRIILPKKELRNILKTVLIDHCTNGKVIDKVKKDFLKIGVLSGDVQDIFNQVITVDQLNDMDVYHLANSLYEILKLEIPNLNPLYYFNNEEVEEIQLTPSTKLASSGDSLPYQINNVTQVSPEHFVAFLSAQEVVEMYNKALIRYRFETQRQPTILKQKDGSLIKVPTLNPQSVKEISERIKKGKFFTNYITLNSTKFDTYVYDEKTRTLRFNNILDIVDGFHRSMGMIEALIDSHGEINYTTGVNFTNFDVERAKQYIEQEEKKNRMDKRYVQSLNSDNNINLVIRKLNQNPYGELKDKIVTDTAYIKHGEALTTTDIIEAGIRTYFGEPKNLGEINKLSEYLTEGFNFIIGEHSDIFYNKNEHKDSVMFKEQMFLGYLFILKLVQGNTNWKEEIRTVLSKFDFSINNKKWNETGILDEFKNINIRKIEQYFKQVLGI